MTVFYGIKYSPVSQKFVTSRVILQGEIDSPAEDNFCNSTTKEAVEAAVGVLNDELEKGNIIVEDCGGNTFRFRSSHISEKKKIKVSTSETKDA